LMAERTRGRNNRQNTNGPAEAGLLERHGNDNNEAFDKQPRVRTGKERTGKQRTGKERANPEIVWMAASDVPSMPLLMYSCVIHLQPQSSAQASELSGNNIQTK
jgi:hypothetical protein